MRRYIENSLVLLTRRVARGPSKFTVADPSPAAAVERHLVSKRDEVSDFEIVAMRKQAEETVVFYTYRLSQAANPDGSLMAAATMFGRAVVEPSLFGWILCRAGAFNVDAGRKRSALVHVHHSDDDDGPLLYGRTLSSEVVGVEAHLQDGSKVADDATDGVFVLYIGSKDAPILLRILDDEGQELERVAY